MIRPACLIILGALSLAACQQGDEAASRASSTTAPALPADPNALTAEGLGPVRIGMSLSELTTAWGPDSQPDAVGGAEPEQCDQFHPERAPEGVLVMVQQGRLTRISLVRDSKVKTDRGFGLGDTGLAIKQAYGGSIVAHAAKYEPAPAEELISWSRGGSTNYVEDPAARGVRYEVDAAGKVTAVHAGDPSIQLVEGCS